MPSLCVRDGVVLVSPPRTAFVVQLLRATMVRLHIQGLSMKERDAKMGASIRTSPRRRALDASARRAPSRAICRLWMLRRSRTKGVLRELDTEISAIVEGAGDAPE